MPLRVLYRRALARDIVASNPTAGLELPAVEGRRDRIATPNELELLLAALEPEDRGLWATAALAGLRRGELRALLWSDVDLEIGRISVERSWDQAEGAVEPKSRAGRRVVPVPTKLATLLSTHRTLTRTQGLVFGITAQTPFEPKAAAKRADAAWTKHRLTRITLHECRHTYAALMIAASRDAGGGVMSIADAKALSMLMGHASITTTLDIYGHLMEDTQATAVDLLDAYLATAASARARR
jgi:integrase